MFGSVAVLTICAAYAAADSVTACSQGIFDSVLSSFTGSQLKTSNITYHANNTFNQGGVRNNVPFCAVDASLSYGQNDTLLFSLWLPDTAAYQGRFLAVGNGALAGTIDYVNMIAQLNAGLGFAVAGGDAGHAASANNNGLGQPGVYLPFLHSSDQVRAWIHDAISLFTPAAKALTEAFYAGQKTRYSYYNGCSTGGAQGIALAQYHPDLFDGVVAGSPGNWYSHLALSFLWNAQQTSTSASRLSQDALSLITNAVLKACDGKDGVQDGLIENPLVCEFNIDSLLCSSTDTGSNGTTCLTITQVDAVKAIYQGPVGLCDGSQIYPGFSLGSESEWALQQGSLANLFAIPLLQNLVYNDLNYDSATFRFDLDTVDVVDERAGDLIDEISPDLSAYRDRNAKLLITQGWTDAFNAATWPIEYLEQIKDYFQEDVGDFLSLFMIPGGGHCGAAVHSPTVPATYHTMTELVKWVETGRKPEYVLSTNPPDGSSRTRKLCPWPKTAKLESGDKNQATSYICS